MKIANSKRSVQWVIVTVALAVSAGCASDRKRTAIGAGAGAAGGAAIGGIAGGGKGAIIGAGLGAVVGGVVGNRLDKQAKELEQVAETKRTEEGILVNLKNDLLFPTGSSTLTPAATTQLTQLAGVLVKYPTNHLVISGHTDDVGTAASNDALSRQRARSVQSVLLQNGVKPDQVLTQGYGESQPIASNKTKEGRSKNRRVEVYITDTEAGKKE
jgi:outer membrane protein OmpA-like peptidoglycan-associated protein